jgi:hypothetical protein
MIKKLVMLPRLHVLSSNPETNLSVVFVVYRCYQTTRISGNSIYRPLI